MSEATAKNFRDRLFQVPWRAARRAPFVTWRTSRPPTEHALRAADVARLSARGQLATRSTARRWQRLLFTATAPDRRLRLRSVVSISF